jgi:hypothetical protein
VTTLVVDALRALLSRVTSSRNVPVAGAWCNNWVAVDARLRPAPEHGVQLGDRYSGGGPFESTAAVSMRS